MSLRERVRAVETIEAKLEVLADAIESLRANRPRFGGAWANDLRPQAATGVKELAEGAGDVRQVFDHWVKAMKKSQVAKLTPERREKIQTRLKDGYSVEFICRAIDGCAGSDFHMARGEDKGGTRHDDLTLICRNGSKLEWFEAMARLSVAGVPSGFVT